MTNQIEIKVPDIGDFSDIPVIEVLVAVGDTVDAEQSLLTLESDKAMMEVPAPVTGVIKELRVAVGDTVSEDQVVAVIEAAEEAEPKPVDAQSPAAPVDAPASAAPATSLLDTMSLTPARAAVRMVASPIRRVVNGHVVYGPCRTPNSGLTISSLAL